MRQDPTVELNHKLQYFSDFSALTLPEQISSEDFVVFVGPGLVGTEGDDGLTFGMHALNSLKIKFTTSCNKSIHCNFSICSTLDF